MKAVPFEGTPPEVKAGDRVQIRDVDGEWHDVIANSEPRYDYDTAVGGHCHLTVSIRFGNETVNWPAEDVRPEFATGGPVPTFAPYTVEPGQTVRRPEDGAT